MLPLVADALGVLHLDASPTRFFVDDRLDVHFVGKSILQPTEGAQRRQGRKCIGNGTVLELVAAVVVVFKVVAANVVVAEAWADFFVKRRLRKKTFGLMQHL